MELFDGLGFDGKEPEAQPKRDGKWQGRERKLLDDVNDVAKELDGRVALCDMMLRVVGDKAAEALEKHREALIKIGALDMGRHECSSGGACMANFHMSPEAAAYIAAHMTEKEATAINKAHQAQMHLEVGETLFWLEVERLVEQKHKPRPRCLNIKREGGKMIVYEVISATSAAATDDEIESMIPEPIRRRLERN